MDDRFTTSQHPMGEIFGKKYYHCKRRIGGNG
jgi:hypothetical protein